MRKKSFLGALVGAVALAIAAVALASPQLTQTADIKLTGTNGKVDKSAGTSANLVENDPGATPAGNFPAATKVVIKLPKGTKADNSAGPQCNLSTTDIANGQCPTKTVIGSGTAVANAVLGPQGPVIQNITAKVTAYNRRNAVAFRVASDPHPLVPQTNIPIISQLSKKGVLTTNVPKVPPAGPNSKTVLTTFKVNIKKKSKQVKRGKRTVTLYLLKSPKTCNGTWTTTADFTYDDGTTKNGIKTVQKCTKPKKK